MKFIGVLFLSIMVGQAFAQMRSPTLTQVQAELEEDELKNLKGHATKFGEIKYYILNGDTTLARRELLKIDSQSPVTYIIKQRYLSLLYFIDGEYELTLKLLSDPVFAHDKAYGKICMLRIFSKIVTDKMDNIQNEYARCVQLNNAYATSYDWVATLINLKLKQPDLLNGKEVVTAVTYTYDIPTLKIWLKLALYLNKESMVLPLISNLNPEAYEDKEIRELVGLIYYRKQKFKSAVNFIEDLQTPNSENIKGNIYLEKKQYELAYGQFKLALAKKQNSYNAIERAVSLAWILNQWQDGLELSQKIILNDRNEAERLTLQAAFFTNLKGFDDAAKRLERAQGFFGNKPPKELSQLYSYVSLMREDQFTMKKYLNLACEASDGFSCWMILNNQVWENFAKTIQRDDALSLGTEMTLASLKVKADIDPLKDPRKIDQRDIEEMDEGTASLIDQKKIGL